MQKIKSFSLLSVLAIGLIISTSCKKEEIRDSLVPIISLDDVSPTSIVALQDSIVFTIEYFDGDGDLGENDPNVENLFIVDKRINAEYGFRIQQLGPDNTTLAIQGELEVVLNNTGITDGSNSQTATFDIYVVDRAGNKSNVVTSETITITE